MKVNKYKFPKKLYSDEYEDATLSEWDLEKLQLYNFEEIWYYYAIGDYCGAGNMIGFKEGKYFVGLIGHCSCYGPCDELTFNEFNSIDEILEGVSGEYYRKELKFLVKKIKNESNR